MAEKKIALNITSAVAIGGRIIVPSSDEATGVLVDESLAKNLLERGRAELATAGDGDGDDAEDGGDTPAPAAKPKSGDKT